MLYTMSRVSFFRISTDEARAILDRILEAEMDNALHDETYEAEVDTAKFFTYFSYPKF